MGTSINAEIISWVKKDHPHACGDKFTNALKETNLTTIIPTRVGTS